MASILSVNVDEIRKAAEIEFTNAFNKNRTVLAGFAKCMGREELHVVRDGFYLGMSKALGLKEYEPVKKAIVEDMKVAAAAGTTGSFEATIQSARSAQGWSDMLGALFRNAEMVGSDLKGIWNGLEEGRMEWLTAINANHQLKESLKTQLAADKKSTPRDVIDAIQVWVYGLGLANPKTKEVALMWSRAAKIEVVTEPLKGYKQELWDPRRKEWAPLDLAVQAAAERAGTTLDAAWKA